MQSNHETPHQNPYHGAGFWYRLHIPVFLDRAHDGRYLFVLDWLDRVDIATLSEVARDTFLLRERKINGNDYVIGLLDGNPKEPFVAHVFELIFQGDQEACHFRRQASLN
ncbi:MAG TPA: hypothetical protein V6C81_28235 [Planktothrix sp.]|jgi:hypothetical protein